MNIRHTHKGICRSHTGSHVTEERTEVEGSRPQSHSAAAQIWNKPACKWDFDEVSDSEEQDVRSENDNGDFL